MPKIKKELFTVRVNGEPKYYTLDIFYRSKGTFFYTTIPDDLVSAVDILSEDQKNELYIYKDYKSRNALDGFSYIVKTNTEESCGKHTRDALQTLVQLVKVERPVILVFFDTPNDDNYGNRSTANKEHPRKGLRLGLLYCLETKVNGGDPSYSYEYGRRVNISYEFQRNGGLIVLDDTPENRAFLENTYNLLTKLIDRMSEFFSDHESLVSLIASNQKLIY